jgi:hypothetical protein
MPRKKIPTSKQWVICRVKPGEPYDAVDIEGRGAKTRKLVIPGTHALTSASANAEPEEGDTQ